MRSWQPGRHNQLSPGAEDHEFEFKLKFDAHHLLNVTRGNDALIALHDRLYRGPQELYLSHEFSYLPHVTVGRLPNDETFRAALAIASRTSIDFEATLDTTTLYAAATNSVESQVVF
jgi:2'-5' RNA ligase